jgi:hypothetical protein
LFFLSSFLIFSIHLFIVSFLAACIHVHTLYTYITFCFCSFFVLFSAFGDDTKLGLYQCYNCHCYNCCRRSSRRYRLDLLSRLEQRDIDVAEALRLSPPPPPPPPPPSPASSNNQSREAPRKAARQRAIAAARASNASGIPLSRRERRILRRHPPPPSPPQPSTEPEATVPPPESTPPTPPPPTPPPPQPKVTKKFALLPMATFKRQYIHLDKVFHFYVQAAHT